MNPSFKEMMNTAMLEIASRPRIPAEPTPWQKLVKRFADGRPICNCGQAYYSPCGEGFDATGKRRTDMLACKHGCSANQLCARDEIAERVLEELS